ncbi:MAG: tRNA epoxyqueuosine(34) reductase QueG [Armatimonadaceae bacterium]
MTREAQVKAKAEEIGFDAVRITTADAPGHLPHVSAWLEAGMHGEMGYLLNRHDLRSGALSDERLLPETCSLIVVALSYDFRNVADPLASGRPHGTVARYARGDDYHNILWEKLKALGAWIEDTWQGTRTRGFCDSGPIRERELAARAGLGWQGKHTNLISLDLGNWFFLGTLLTTLALEPDAPTSAHCGTCTRCLQACPTGAIVAPLTLDARRCISYLTIELKGSIPVELRPLMGDRIFGCDDCLAACPWNDRARQGREARLMARSPDAAFPDLLDWLELLAEEATFKAKFRGTPLLRPGRAGLRRNVCVALGNVGGAESLAALAVVRDTDPSEMVREHANWAIAEIEQQLRRETSAGMPGNGGRSGGTSVK